MQELMDGAGVHTFVSNFQDEQDLTNMARAKPRRASSARSLSEIYIIINVVDGQDDATMVQVPPKASKIRCLGSANAPPNNAPFATASPPRQGSAPPNNAPYATTSPPGQGSIGAYTAEERLARIARFMEKRRRRMWTKRVIYGVRKDFANSRSRIKGRFVKKKEEPSPAP